MQEALFKALLQRRPAIRAQWEALLRTERVATPLGNPDVLVHLIDWTLDEILQRLGSPTPSPQPPAAAPREPDDDSLCACGRSPLIAYFTAGRQATREALVLAQAAEPVDPPERDATFEELNRTLSHIARREVLAFCGVCQFRGAGANLRMQPLAVG